MVNNDYIPARGDLVWMDFSPHRGHEQGGRRPAVVISLKMYNERSGLALVCPVTSKRKDYPFEVEIKGRKVGGFVLADQVRGADWKARRAEFVSAVAAEVLEEIEDKISALLGKMRP